MIDILLLVLLQPNPVISPRHPHSALPWVQSVRARCGSTALAIDGYGAAKPLEGVPELLINDQPITGKSIPLLLNDLSNRRAVYRLQILCGDPGEITVRIDEGEKQAGGAVRYRSGAAFIEAGRLVTYTGLEEADADSFWFR